MEQQHQQQQMMNRGRERGPLELTTGSSSHNDDDEQGNHGHLVRRRHDDNNGSGSDDFDSDDDNGGELGHLTTATVSTKSRRLRSKREGIGGVDHSDPVQDSVRADGDIDDENDAEYSSQRSLFMSTSRSEPQRLSPIDASMHLMKGNLGPGCLNLPHAFSLLNSWAVGLVLFAIVIIQGIYSMAILCICKWHINSSNTTRSQRRRDQSTSRTNGPEEHYDVDDNDNDHNTSNIHNSDGMVHTFMDVAYVSLGRQGAVVVEIFVFVLQAGVCCVFLSLISTNLRASFPTIFYTNQESVVVTTAALLGIVLLNNLSKLKWLSTFANLLMFITILTASTAAMLVILGYTDVNSNGDSSEEGDGDADDNVYVSTEQEHPHQSDLGSIASFVASMFFSFEGIGLVLPIEQAFMGEEHQQGEETEQTEHQHQQRPPARLPDPSTQEEEPGIDNHEHEEGKHQRQQVFLWKVLLGSMMTVASLFLLVGLTCSLAFPNIESGSITAYLRTTFPNQQWYDICNGLVVLAVFLTFPLQLTPAMEVLDEWFGPGCDPKCTRASIACCSVGSVVASQQRRRQRDGAEVIQQDDPDRDGNVGDVFHDEEPHENNDGNHTSSTWIHGNSGRDGLIVEGSDRKRRNTKTANGKTNGDQFHTDLLRATASLDTAVLPEEGNDERHAVDDQSPSPSNVFVLHETPTSSPTPSHDRRGDDNGIEGTDNHRDILHPLPPTNSCFGKREWIFRRWMMVVACALVVLLVDDLAILVTLFGAVGQTGLAFMPCLIHLKLQRRGVVPQSTVLSFLNGCTIAFSLVVMFSGIVFSIQAIIYEKES